MTERLVSKLHVALLSYDEREIRVRKNYLEEQNPAICCVCFHSGEELLRELRQCGAHLDVILLTAAREAAALQEAMRLGVVDFILKPVVFERLRDTLDKYCQSRAALAALADIDQQAVDALFGTPLQQVAAGGLPKGIDALTLQRVLAALNLQGASAEEIGNRVGVSRTTARRYLEFLVGQQLASPELEYGTVGRPERRYRQR